ncbi:MAG: 16S rRNA (adenine(1518)-N(6)/adenine(1519)-N(6))-dimethyltransferase RsmA [Candidatus Izemoplasmatales bacterium]
MKNHNEYVNELVNKNNFFIKKKYSQNFLLDENIIKKIIKAANIDENTFVIEIGPGFGALTKYLVKQAKKVLLYEIDKELIPHLNKLFNNYDNITILNKDFLKVEDIDKDIDLYLDNAKDICVISNLPYHITTPIIMKILEESKKIDRLIIMMQLEVAKRLTSSPDSKDYNALSVIIQDQTKADYLFKVPKTVFQPRPKVDSAIIELKLLNKKIKDNNYYKFVHKCFSQRRKTLINNLATNYEISKDKLKIILKKLNISVKIRAEALTNKDLKNIYNKFKEEEII